jgi:hypothetical protein
MSGIDWRVSRGTFLDILVHGVLAHVWYGELGYNQQALYCYRKVYSLDPTNVDALWDRASLAKETGDLKTVSSIHILPFPTNISPPPLGPHSLPRDPQTLPARPHRPLRAAHPPHRALRAPHLCLPLPIRIHPLPIHIPLRPRPRLLHTASHRGSWGRVRADGGAGARGFV